MATLPIGYAFLRENLATRNGHGVGNTACEK